MGPRGSSVFFFLVVFLFLLFLCLQSSFSFCCLSSFSCCSCSPSCRLLSFSPFFVSSSYHLPPFSCRFFGLCLSSRSCHLLSFNHLPVTPVTLLSLSITFLLSSVVSFFLAFRLLLSLFFHRLPFAVYRRFLPFFPVVSSYYFLPTSCRHLCFPFCRLLHYSCPIPGASPHPPSLFFPFASSLVPSVSYLSSMTSISRTSVAAFFPKDLCSSPFISAGAGPSYASDFLRRLLPRIFLLVLVLLPLLPLVLFMMALFSILSLMMDLIGGGGGGCCVPIHRQRRLILRLFLF